jgi:cytidylate kinase
LVATLGARWSRPPTPDQALRLFVTGPAGSGKSTLAGLLVERHGFERLSLGDIPRSLAAGRGVAPTRAALQALGDELRGGDPAAVARLALPRMAGARRIVVDGVRLPEEALLLRAEGFVGIGLSVPVGERRRRLEARGERWAGPEATHATETAFVPCDIRLECTGGLDALEATAACLLRLAVLLVGHSGPPPHEDRPMRRA